MASNVVCRQRGRLAEHCVPAVRYASGRYCLVVVVAPRDSTSPNNFELAQVQVHLIAVHRVLSTVAAGYVTRGWA